ncbi:MAG: MBL fold metallo-hydrolase [Lentisphaeraceae bacterium]|nr:MBL fold metallo-hydrolase [Lentisphaeraceae bacterium]
MFDIEFQGAARTTTGSMHIVNVNGLRILLDCGLYQGHRKEAFERNRQLAVDARSVDCVLLSHAHIDHSGNLPSLVRAGYRGPIYTTEATRDLCDPMLRDCAYITQHDVTIVNRRRQAEGKRLFEPLYLEQDVERTLSQMRGVPYKRVIDLGNNVGAVFHNAGHILGSALVELFAKQPNGTYRRLLFSGDLGQPGQPIIPPPEVVEGPDVLLVESTYADREHPPRANILGRLRDYILDITQQRAKLIIPAFSVGRTQQILFFLNQLLREGRIPRLPIYVDSPLSLKATQIYAKHTACYGEAASELLRQGVDLFKMPGLQFLATPEQSKALNHAQGPMIVIAASGMCEGGRILHHLQNGVGDPRNIILIVGYQAEGTLGRRIVELQSPLKILGEEFDLQARVHTINALSAHADRIALRNWVRAVNAKRAVKHVFAVHGEEEKVQAMCQILREEGYSNPIAPAPGAIFKGL